ncbi:MAG TPA: ABC transporter permease subunit [Firmicutes bacterium]|nr:ABC transporter permease subunit [Bacillota bacterium]
MNPETRQTMRLIARNPLTLGGLAIILLLVVVALAAPLLAPFAPTEINLGDRLLPPGPGHLFGTDEMGRDIFSRVVWGARISIRIAVTVVAIAGLAGSVLGAVAGYLSGPVDTVIMRVMDMILAFPSLVLAMVLAAVLGPSLNNALLAIAVIQIPKYARLVRGQALSLREKQFVQAARVCGATTPWIILNHILPGALSPVLVLATMGMGEAILLAASLSFIGLGAQPPEPEWGAMVAMGRKYLMDQAWLSAFPGLAILLVAVGFNILGDGLRDILDPKLRR